MIRAICLNPVIDRTYHINCFTPGRKFFHLKPDLSVGGKGINVAKVCRLCGEEVALYGYIAGSNGNLIHSEMEKAGIHSYLMAIEGNSRETINIIDLAGGNETEIVEQGPFVNGGQVRCLLSKLQKDIREGDIIVCSGIRIDGAPEDFYGQINRMCKRAGAKCFLDTNDVTAQELMEQQYDFYKPNALEAAALFKEKELDRKSAALRVRGLLKTEAQQILVSLGAEGGMLVTKSKCLVANTPKVKVSSTIGCGDSAVAGFAVGTKRGWGEELCLRYAMACGTVNSLYPQVGVIDIELVHEMVGRIEIEEVSVGGH